MNNKDLKKPLHQVFILIGLLLLVFSQTFSAAIRDKMHQRIPEALDPYAEAISIAISRANFGIDGYAGYRKIYDTLIANGFDWYHHDQPAVLNNAIEQAVNIKEPGVERVFFSVGDIGLIDYTRSAFALFGYKIESLLYLYFLILFIQVAVFLIEFRKNDLAVAGLVLFLLGHYIIVNGLYGAGYNLWTVHNNRFLSVLGILSVTHICLLALFQKPLKLNTFLGAFVQIMIFVFILRCRNSALWMLGPLVLVSVAAALGWGIKRFTLFKKELSLPGIKPWPVIIALGAVLLSIFIKPYILSPEYYGEKNLASHAFWYSIYIGMAINPEIREIYGPRDPYKPIDAVSRFAEVCDEAHSDDSPLKAKARIFVCKNRKIAEIPLVALRNWNQWILNYTQNDQDAARAVLQWLRANGKTEEHIYTFGPEDKVGYPRWFGQCESKEKYLQYEPFNKDLRPFDSKKDFKWREMERIVGIVAKDALMHHPFLVLKTAVIIKPFFFLLYYILYFLRITSLWGVILIAATYGYLLFCVRNFTHSEMKKFLAFLFGMFVLSMVVTVVTYPAPHTISDQVVLLTVCILGLSLYLLNKKRIKTQ